MFNLPPPLPLLFWTVEQTFAKQSQCLDIRTIESWENLDFASCEKQRTTKLQIPSFCCSYFTQHFRSLQPYSLTCYCALKVLVHLKWWGQTDAKSQKNERFHHRNSQKISWCFKSRRWTVPTARPSLLKSSRSEEITWKEDNVSHVTFSSSSVASLRAR